MVEHNWAGPINTAESWIDDSNLLNFTLVWSTVVAMLLSWIALLLRQRQGSPQWLCLIGTAGLACCTLHKWGTTMCFTSYRDMIPTDADLGAFNGTVPVFDAAARDGWTGAGAPTSGNLGFVLRSHRSQRLPLVVRALGADVVSSKAWTPDALRQRWGGHEVEFHAGNIELRGRDLMHAPLHKFIERSDMLHDRTLAQQHAGDVLYVSESASFFRSVGHDNYHVRQLFSVLDRTQLLDPPVRSWEASLWLGPAGASTGVHADIEGGNYLLHLHGSKTVWLLPLADGAALPPSKRYDSGSFLADIDPFASPSASVLRHAARTILRPGDVLYIPPRMFHYARANTASVGVSLRTYTLCEELASQWYTALDLLHHAGVYRHGNCTCHRSQGGGNTASVVALAKLLLSLPWIPQAVLRALLLPWAHALHAGIVVLMLAVALTASHSIGTTLM